MNNLDLILYVFAFVCFCLAAGGVPTNRFNMIGAGLAFWVLTYIL